MKYPSEEELLKTFGQRIKFLRKKHKLSQTALAGKAELEKTAIQRIERGYNSTMKTLRKLANGFDMTLSELLKINESQNLED